MASITRALILVATLAMTAALVGCDEQTSADVATVRVGGRWFHLEIAADQKTQFKGLGGRDYIAPDGGMIFVFRDQRVRQFVMRDCPIDIDIVFLDGGGRITAWHAMTVEHPQREGETDAAYEARLKRYSSGFPSQFALEFAGGTLADLHLSRGDKVELDLEHLKTLAK